MILDMNRDFSYFLFLNQVSFCYIYVCTLISLYMDIKKIFRYLITQYFSRFIKILNVNEINEF